MKDDVFTLHGSPAFALVLAVWMYSDVPVINVLAPDRQRVMAAIDDAVLLRRLLYAQNIVLWAFITPVCAESRWSPASPAIICWRPCTRSSGSESSHSAHSE